MNGSDIEVILAGDDTYEEPTAEIFCDGKFIALLNQDGGFDHLKIEFPGTDVEENMVSRSIELASFEKGLEMAKQKLKGM